MFKFNRANRKLLPLNISGQTFFLVPFPFSFSLTFQLARPCIINTFASKDIWLDLSARRYSKYRKIHKRTYEFSDTIRMKAKIRVVQANRESWRNVISVYTQKAIRDAICRTHQPRWGIEKQFRATLGAWETIGKTTKRRGEARVRRGSRCPVWPTRSSTQPRRSFPREERLLSREAKAERRKFASLDVLIQVLHSNDFFNQAVRKYQLEHACDLEEKSTD